MTYAWKQTVAPTSDPIDVTTANSRLRIVSRDEDVDTLQRIRSATRQTEEYLGRGLMTQTWVFAQDDFTNEMWLPRAAPLQSVTSVKYYDESGTQQTLSTSTYLVDSMSEPGRVMLAPNKVWPVVQAFRALAVEITYVVGWTNVDDIPPDIVDAICLRVGDRDAYRENSVIGMGVAALPLPDGVEAMLASHRVFWREPICEY